MAQQKLSPIPKRTKRGRRAAEDMPSTASEQPRAEPDLSHIAESLRPLAVPVAELTFMVGNPLTHPDEQIEDLKASLREFGQVEAFVVNRRMTPPVVIGGNGRLRAALSIGWTHVAAAFVDLPEAKANALAVILNRSREGASWDKEALDKLLREIDVGADERLNQILTELATEQGIQLGPEPPEDPGPQLDQAEALQRKWGTAVGQIWVAESKTAPPRKFVKCTHCDCEQELE